MPRTPRNPGSGKAPVNTPARNEPATGDGWGGPPNGEGNRQAGPGRPEGVANGEGKQTVAELLAGRGARQIIADMWLAIIKDPKHPHHATMLVKGADRIDGTAVATTISASVDEFAELTDAELEARIDRARRLLAGGGSCAGEAESGE